MRVPLTFLAASLLLANAGHASATDTRIPDATVKAAEQLRDKALTDDTGYKIVTSLTTEVGPRIAGGVNDARGRAWAIAKFKELGYDKVYTEAVTYPLWQRRSEHGAIVAPFPQPLALTALGFSAGTPQGGLTAEVVKFDSLDALKAADPASVKGKIVYIGFRMTRQKDGHDYGMGSAIRTGGPAIASARVQPLSSCARPAPMRIAARRIPASPCSKIPHRRFLRLRCRIPMPTSLSACSATASRSA
jgi:hypothetical protein